MTVQRAGDLPGVAEFQLDDLASGVAVAGRPVQLTVVVQAGVAAADAAASGTATPQPSAATLAAMSAQRMNLRMVIATLT